MELVIRNTTGKAPYGDHEIMHSEQVADLNAGEQAFERWCAANLAEHDQRPQGVVVDEDGNEYHAETGALLSN